MLGFSAYLAKSGLSQAEMARRLSKRLDRRVPPQSVFRWTRPHSHPDYCVPEPDVVVAIYVESDGQVTPNTFYDLPELEQPRAAA